MAVNGRKRDLLSSRRRVADEGEEEDGVEDLVDDSLSEASVLTGDVVDGESETSETNKHSAAAPAPETNGVQNADKKRQRHKARKAPADGKVQNETGPRGFVNTADTDLMVNGINTDTMTEAEAIDFEDTTAQATGNTRIGGPNDGMTHQTGSKGKPRVPSSTNPSATARGNKSGIPDASKKSDNVETSKWLDRSSLPYRGGPGYKQNQRPLPPHVPASTQRWDHDLHETIIDTPVAPRQPQSKPNSGPNAAVAKPKSMSKSVTIGNVAARVYLPQMEVPLVLNKKILIRQHTKLPDLRPPLRRDKPVRISLPGCQPRYIFPSIERSFIFIPRAQRPNQQNRHKGRGQWSRAGSRRTSVYGGSAYSPSIPPSRRSSFVRDGISSPGGMMLPRASMGSMGQVRPIVRLPQAAPTPFGPAGPNYAWEAAYPLPSEPVRREHRSSQMTMHQPRPQKQMSVASIEGEQQAFHQQLPFNTSGQGSADAGGVTQAEAGTPLANIPEGAINAQPFQPSAIPPHYYAYPVQQMYYYPADGQQGYGGAAMASPVYVPQPYYIPMMMPMGNRTDGAHPANMYMQESNGMVYYYDTAQLVGGESAAQAGEGYYTPQPAFYAPQ